MPTFYGCVTGVRHLAEDFCIFDLAVDSSEPEKEYVRQICVSGHLYGLAQVRIGITLGVTGAWVEHPKYGKQIQPFGWTTYARSTADVERFLSTCLRGFEDGDLVRFLVSTYGTEVYEKLRHAPDEIRSLFDAGDPRRIVADKAISGWESASSMSALASFLRDNDLGIYQVRAIFDTLGNDAVNIIAANPYRLVAVEGFSFTKADRLAARLGIDRNDGRRLEGAILAILWQESRQGHLCVRRGDLPMLIGTLMDSEFVEGFKIADLPGAITSAVDRLVEHKSVLLDPTVGIYLPDLYKYERETAEKLARFLTPSKLDINLTEFLTEYEKGHAIELSELQRVAVHKLIENRVLVLTGGPGTGKCVMADTIVSGPWGFAPIGAFLPPDLPPDSAKFLDVRLDTSQGVEHTAYVFNGGVTRTLRIRTGCGYELEGTPEHSVRVVRDGKIVWVRLDELRVGDVTVIQRGGYSFGSSTTLAPYIRDDLREKFFASPEALSEELATLLGYVTSEGTTTSPRCLSISQHDPRVRGRIIDLFRVCFGTLPSTHKDKRVEAYEVGVRFWGTAFMRWLLTLGVKPEFADAKTVPDVIMKGPRWAVRAYLRGLFEGDGSVDPTRRTVEYGTSSRVLAVQLQVLMLAFGVVTNRHNCVRGGKPYYRLKIYGEDYDCFRWSVGFDITHLPERTCRTNTNKHVIYGAHGWIDELLNEQSLPRKVRLAFRRYSWDKTIRSKARRPSRHKLRQILALQNTPSKATGALHLLMGDNVFYDPVEQIVAGHGPVVDFGVPKGHEFLSGGFISHNTTLVRTFVRLFKQTGITCQLMAPTGIAAKRLAAVTGSDAATVHRTFGYNGRRWLFNVFNKFPVGAVIVDEMSMVDQELFYRILSALHPSTMLILVGDDAQLPSVGPGNVLREMLSCSEIPHVRLTQIFRQAEKSDIVQMSHRINRGEALTLDNRPAASDFQFVNCNDENVLADLIVKMAEKLKARDANFQVLSPKYDGIMGVTNLNDRLREALNPESGQPEWRAGKIHMRIGDRVMITKNDYDLNVYNGDMGKLHAIHKQDLVVKIHGIADAELYVTISKSKAVEMLRLAYCITVHKSQGSEFDTIVMPIVKAHGRMRQRNLFYTAVTRARKKVWLLGDTFSVHQAIQNDKVVQRNTVFGRAVRDAVKALVGVEPAHDNGSPAEDHGQPDGAATGAPQEAAG